MHILVPACITLTCIYFLQRSITSLVNVNHLSTCISCFYLLVHRRRVCTSSRHITHKLLLTRSSQICLRAVGDLHIINELLHVCSYIPTFMRCETWTLHMIHMNVYTYALHKHRCRKLETCALLMNYVYMYNLHNPTCRRCETCSTQCRMGSCFCEPCWKRSSRMQRRNDTACCSSMIPSSSRWSKPRTCWWRRWKGRGWWEGGGGKGREKGESWEWWMVGVRCTAKSRFWNLSLLMFLTWGIHSYTGQTGFSSHLISSRLCPSTAGCSPPSMSSIFVCLLPS